MNKKPTRRETLKGIGSAGLAALIEAPSLTARETPIQIMGRPVEIAVSVIGPQTVRISVTPIVNGQRQPIPDDGSLLSTGWPQPAARIRSLTGSRSLRCGELTVALSAEPLTIRIEARDGRPVQQLGIDPSTGAVNFRLGDQPVLGLGQGGPQFDRRGSNDLMRSGQGGYRRMARASLFNG
jgi:alpha-glucosidase/alpha-D-xyloside xylohydrolase